MAAPAASARDFDPGYHYVWTKHPGGGPGMAWLLEPVGEEDVGPLLGTEPCLMHIAGA